MPPTIDTLTLTRPDDWHLHVRDGEALTTVVPHTAAQFGRAVIMPNLKPPVTTAAQALAYRSRIAAAVPQGVSFEPLMTLYHHQQRRGRHRFAQNLPHAGGHAAFRAVAAGARRSHFARHRFV